MLLHDLFNPHKPVNSSLKGKYMFLLAYAATVSENDDSMMDEYDQDFELKEAIRALETVQPICQRNSFGFELQASVAEIRENLQYIFVLSRLTFDKHSHCMHGSIAMDQSQL